MYHQISEFFPAPYDVGHALNNPKLRPWVKYWYSTYFHDLDLYEIGHC